MENELQEKIIKSLVESKSFFAYAIANLKSEHFEEDKSPIIDAIKKHYNKYNEVPEYSILVTEISSDRKISDEIKDEIEETIKRIKKYDFNIEKNFQWICDQVEQFVTDREIFDVMKAGIIESKKEDSQRDYGKLKLQMEKALSINWGHDYGLEFFDEDTIDEVYDMLNDASIRIPTGISVVDDAIGGGFPGQTKFIAVFVGQAGLGKCCSYVNTIKVRNKKTGEIITMPVGEFHESIKEKNGNAI
jgi:predicted small secreted protein